MARRNKIVIISTGGTIAMQDSGEGALPALSGEELAARLPDWGEGVEIEVETFSNIPSGHLTLEQLWQLQKVVAERLERLYVRGVVVTHGTDTMEETAYLLDLTIPSNKAVVLTGAMLHASEPGYDGIRNLTDAVRVALDPQSDNRGAMVVMNGEIHAARYVTKMKSHGVDAFASPGRGPMGRVIEGHIHWYWSLEREALPVKRLVPNVHLIKATLGMPDTLLRLLIEQNVAGIVIEGFGGGRVPPWWMDAIREARAKGILVAIAGRVPVAHSMDAYGYPGAYRDLEEAGVLFAEGLNGPKARLKLMAILGGLVG